MKSAWPAVVVASFAAVVAPAVATAGLPGEGSDGRCDGRRPTAFEREVSRAQGFRQSVGIPSDEAHIIGVLRDRAHQVLVKEWRQWLTPQEYAYYRARVALAGKMALVRQHVKQSAGSEDLRALQIEGYFPNDPYIAARFSKDVERHAQNLGSLGFPIRVLLAASTQQYLKDVMQRLRAEHDRLASEGIWLSSYGVFESENAVVVNLISSRPDAVELVERTFGPGVRAVLIAEELTRDVCTSAGSYRVGPSGRTLRILWRTNSVYKLIRIKVHETSRSVRVAIIERTPNGPVTLAAKFPKVLVKLKTPLGRRSVVDAETGRKLRLGVERHRLLR